MRYVLRQSFSRALLRLWMPMLKAGLLKSIGNSFAFPNGIRFALLRTVVFTLLICTCFRSARLDAAENSSHASALKHTSADGSVVQALLFQLNERSIGVSPHNHFVFFDTSASQVGDHRLQAIGVLESMLNSLPDTDRVQLFAVDVEAVPLMKSLASPRSNSVVVGLKALRSRIPLGATSLESVIQTALKTSTSDPRCSITYIGDGMSTADLLEPTELQKLVSDLRHHEIPFHSYGVGLHINLQLLGILAHRTGG